LLTAWLLALSLPTLAPWWLYAVGIGIAIVVAKQIYGGLGQNLFNPAMVGYAALIVSFPVYMTQWPAPVALADHARRCGMRSMWCSPARARSAPTPTPRPPCWIPGKPRRV
jgi:Na+-translocating ferredoxin:NAD+ oxidoreductase RnfD subunit